MGVKRELAVRVRGCEDELWQKRGRREGAEERKEGGGLCQHNHAFVDLPEVSLFEQQQLRQICTPTARSLVTYSS